MSFGKIMGKDDPKDNRPADNRPAGIGVGNAQASSAKSEAVLGKGSKVVGNLTFTGPVEIGGQVEGEITAQDKILVTETAEINAKINGAEVTIMGVVNGDIVASKRLLLKKPAKVFGNISSTNLSIEEGVVFEGKCSMSLPDDASKSGSKVVSSNKVAGSI